MPKTAVVLLAEGFEEVEAIAPVDALRRAGVRVMLAGVSDKIVKSSRNILVQADISLKDIKELPDAVGFLVRQISQSQKKSENFSRRWMPLKNSLLQSVRRLRSCLRLSGS